MPESIPMVGQLLAMPDEDHRGSERVQRDVQRFKDRVAEEIKKVRWTAKMPELVKKIAQMLEIPLPDVMIAAWEKGDEIKKALEDSGLSPEDEFNVELAEHTLSTEFEPQIEIQVAKFPAAVLQFVVKLSLELKGIELRIRKGEIRQIRTGSCQASGELLLEDLLLAERKLEPFQLPEVISMEHPGG